MKKNILWIMLLISLIMACGGESGDGDDGPAITKDYLSVPPNMSLLGDGESQNLTIDANCSWTISTDIDWLTVNPMSGLNKQTIMVTAGKNTSGSARSAVLTVRGGSLTRRVTVSQAKATDTPDVTPILSVNVSSMEFARQGGTKSFIISSNTDWMVTCPSWCTASTSSGKGNATITITVGENETTVEKNGNVIISGTGVNTAVIAVNQEPGETQSHQPGAGDNQPPSW